MSFTINNILKDTKPRQETEIVRSIPELVTGRFYNNARNAGECCPYGNFDFKAYRRNTLGDSPAFSEEIVNPESSEFGKNFYPYLQYNRLFSFTAASNYVPVIIPFQCNHYKRKGGQVRFSTNQTTALEKEFCSHMYLSPEDRRTLAETLKLTDRQVKTWFQNRRAKWRRNKTSGPFLGVKEKVKEKK